MNYHYKLELLSYSKWDKQTIICGQIKNADPEEICLEYYSGMVGNDVKHIFAETKADGSFSIPLEIEDPVRYRLFLLKNFPIYKNKHVNLYVEPGDSIHVYIGEGDKAVPQFSGRGYRNSEFMNSGSLVRYMSTSFRVLIPMSFHWYIDFLYLSRKTLIKTEKSLEADKDMLTKGFYRYMRTEIKNLRDMLEISEAWSNHIKDFRAGKPINISLPELPMPQVPNYDNLSNLEQYGNFVRVYSDFRYQQFYLFNANRYGSRNITDQLIFSKILLNGYPLYSDLVNQLEVLAGRPDKEHLNYRYFFKEFLGSCNNREVSDYVRHLYKQVELLQPGKEMPRMDLFDLNGKRWDWEKTKGKIVVLMLVNDYDNAQYLSEELYKKYGYNKKDVIILRISQGISFQQWKKFNSIYSDDMHQMFFTDGEDAYNDRFIFTFMNTNVIPRSGYRYSFLVVDRNGKIFRNATFPNLKTAIKEALAQPLPPNKPFIETTFARIFFGALLGMLFSFALYRIIIYRRLKQRSLMQRMSDLGLPLRQHRRSECIKIQEMYIYSITPLLCPLL